MKLKIERKQDTIKINKTDVKNKENSQTWLRDGISEIRIEMEKNSEYSTHSRKGIENIKKGLRRQSKRAQ